MLIRRFHITAETERLPVKDETDPVKTFECQYLTNSNFRFEYQVQNNHRYCQFTVPAACLSLFSLSHTTKIIEYYMTRHATNHKLYFPDSIASWVPLGAPLHYT